MCRAIVLTVVGALALFQGCSGATGDPQPGVGPGGGGSSGDPKADIIDAYREGLESKNVDALLALYCWDGVSADLRETIRENVQDQTLQSVAEVRVDPAEPGKFGETVEGDKRWRPNLEVTDMLVVKFEEQAGFGLTGMEAGIGLKDGRYLIAVMVPAD